MAVSPPRTTSSCIGTFSWSSLADLRHHPHRSNLVMLATVPTVVGTHNLALGVGVGVLLSGIFFASAEDFLDAFNFAEPLDAVTIDVSQAHIWELTGVNAIDKTVLEFRKADIEVEVLGLNQASTTIMDKLAMHDQPDAMERVLGH